MDISRDLFDQQRRPRFGTANPERMQLAFWEWMIRGSDSPPGPEGGALAQFGQVMRNGMLKSCYGPWRALTNRNWRQFSIHLERWEHFGTEDLIELEDILPCSIRHVVVPNENASRIHFVVEGVLVCVIVGVREIEIIVEGELPGELTLRVIKELRANAETAFKRRCMLEQVQGSALNPPLH